MFQTVLTVVTQSAEVTRRDFMALGSIVALDIGLPELNLWDRIFGGSDPTVEQLSYEPGHTSWESGLDTVEVYRTELEEGQRLELDRVEIQLKGGGSRDDIEVSVFDVATLAEIDSATAGAASQNGGTSEPGATITIRVTNNSSSSQAAGPIVRGRIVEA